MITEFAIATTIVYGIRYIQNAPNRKLKRKFDSIVYESKLENKSKETYKLWNIKKTKYGFSALINIPEGMDIEKLQSIKTIISTNLKCMVEIEQPPLKDFGYIKIITSPCDTFDFEPVETKEYEIFLGYKPDGTPQILDLRTNCHCIICGQTGTGKSFLFASILTNMIYHNKKDIEVYLFQVMKGEIDIFADCPSVKFASDNPSEILYMLKKLNDMIHRRSKQFTESGIKNITQWNNHFPKKKMKRIIVGVEEISFFMQEEKKDNKEENEDSFFQYFNNIVKAGRSVGIHLICLTQRTTVANLGGNGELKSQMTVISAKQRSIADSQNAVTVPDAFYVGKQEFIGSVNEGFIRFKAPTIDEDYKILNKYVPEIRIPNQPTIDVKKKTTINTILSYEESQKLKTKSEFNILIKEEPIINDIKENETINEESIEPPKQEKKKRVPRKKGAVKKEVKEVAIDNETDGL